MVYATDTNTTRSLRCSKCEQVKPEDAFDKDKSKPSGRRAQCKTCRYSKRKLAAVPDQPLTEDRTKTCGGCGQELSVAEFHKDASKPDGFHTRCKNCKGKTNRAKKQALTEEQREHLERQQRVGEANRKAILRLIDNHRGEFDRLAYSEKVRAGLIEPTAWNAREHMTELEEHEGLTGQMMSSLAAN